MKSPIWDGDHAPATLWAYRTLRPSGHYSVDLPLPVGSPLYAPGPGRVIACNDGVHNQPPGRPAGSGAPSNWMIIEYTPTGGPYKGQKVRAYYQHLDKGGTLGARPGKRFAYREKIARSGNSGNTYGPHLHLTVFKPGQGPSGAGDRYVYLSAPSRVIWPPEKAWGDSGPRIVYMSKLKPGVKDSASVREIRASLVARGLLEPKVKGRPGNDWSEKVTEAVRNWQRRNGLKPTGRLTRPQAERLMAKKVKAGRVKVVP